MVGFSELVHLLLVLPPSAANLTRAALDELDVIEPDRSRVPVHSNVVNDELVGLGNGAPSLASGIVGQIISPPDVVEIHCPEPDVRNGHQASAKKLLGCGELVEAQLQFDPLHPYVRL
jgi:hypothetical protein